MVAFICQYGRNPYSSVPPRAGTGVGVGGTVGRTSGVEVGLPAGALVPDAPGEMPGATTTLPKPPDNSRAPTETSTASRASTNTRRRLVIAARVGDPQPAPIGATLGPVAQSAQLSVS